MMCRARFAPASLLLCTGLALVTATAAAAAPGQRIEVAASPWPAPRGIDPTPGEPVPGSEENEAPAPVPQGSEARIVMPGAPAGTTPAATGASTVSAAGADAATGAPATAEDGRIALPGAVPAQTDDAATIPFAAETAAAGAGRISLGETAGIPTAADEALPQALAGLWPSEPGRARDGRARLQGEVAKAEFIVISPNGQVPTELVLSTRSSAYVLPEESELRVSVNGQDLGLIDVQAAGEAASQRVALPAGLLLPGANRVTLSATHRHRVFCGAAAAYDLWTEIDLGQSGLPLAGPVAGTGQADFLAAMAARRAEGRALTISYPGGSEREVLRLVGTIGARLGGGLDIVPVAAGGETPADIEVVSGTRPDTEIVAGEGGPRLLMTVADGASLDLTGTFGPEPVAAQDPVVTPGDPITFGALGIEDTEVARHLWHGRWNFRLPETWVLTTNERAEMRLQLASSYGMPRDSQLRILINGAPIRIVPLDRANLTGILNIRFPARLMQAGRNEMEFELVVPGDPADQQCPRVIAPKIAIGAASTLFVPTAPEMDLAGLGGSVGALDRDSLSASLIRATTEDEATRVLALAQIMPDRAGADTPAPRADSLLLADLETIDPETFGALWSGRSDVIAALLRPEAPDTGPRGLLPTTAEGEVVTLNQMSFFGVDPVVSDITGTVKQAAESTFDLLFPKPSRDLSAWLGAQNGQALLYRIDAALDAPVHLVLADDADIHLAAGQIARSRTAGVPLAGHVALLDWDGQWHTWRDRSRLPQLVGEPTATNLRAVIGNYASARPLIFVGALLLLTLVSALLARTFLVRTRGEYGDAA